MELRKLLELVALLSGPTLTVRTGLWIAPVRVMGQESDYAARIGIDARDIRLPIKANLPPGTRYLGLSVDTLVQGLDHICRRNDGSTCVLVYNLDLLLARLRSHEREEFWRYVYGGFPHRPRGLLLLMPTTAEHLLPSKQTYDAWRQDGRLFTDPDAN